MPSEQLQKPPHAAMLGFPVGKIDNDFPHTLKKVDFFSPLKFLMDNGTVLYSTAYIFIFYSNPSSIIVGVFRIPSLFSPFVIHFERRVNA